MGRHKPIDMKARALLAAIDPVVLQRLLPPNYKVEFNEEERIMNIFTIDPPRLVAQPRFPKSQWYILLALFASSSDYAPYEFLLSCLTELSVSECRTRIHQAQQLGSQALNCELKLVYTAVSGMRTTLNNSIPSLKVSCFHDAGYMFVSEKTGDAFAER